MNILKKTMVAVIAVTSLGTTGSILTATSAQAHKTYNWHAPHKTYNAPKCGWEWVKWQDSYGWHKRRKWVCH